MNPYASALLNDLHHFFPELLYYSERFQNVQDVLQYVVSVAQESPFERERRRYRGPPSPVPPSEEVPYRQEQEQGQEQEQEQEQGQEQEEEKKEQPVYQFMESSSAYSVAPPSSASSASTSSASSSSSSPHRVADRTESSRAISDSAQALLNILFQQRSNVSPIRSSAQRFRLSVPLSMSSFMSSQYAAPAPSALQGLSQLQELFQPVIVRPTQQHLAENTYVYRSEIPLGENCSICQDPMEAGQETRTILACSHCFHRECIDKWFEAHVQCPVCRHDVREI